MQQTMSHQPDTYADVLWAGRYRGMSEDEWVSVALVRAQLDVRRFTVAQWRALIDTAFSAAREAVQREDRRELDK